MRKRTKITLFAVIALVIAGIIFFPAIKSLFTSSEAPQLSGAPADGGGRSTLQVIARVVQAETLLDEIRASRATLFPDEEVELTFETAGKITSIYFKEGSAVRKGTVLAKINDKPLQAQLQKLEAQIPLAEDRLSRHRVLLDKDAVSREAFEQVSTELDKLRADIALAKAQIAQTELRAPFDGHVGLRNVSEGAYASTTTIITTLTKTIPLKVEFSINEKYVDVVKPGTPITFRVQSEDEQNDYSATVYALDSKVDSKTYTRKVRALYPNPGGKLFPGRSAAITIRTNEIKNAIIAPAESVIKEQGLDIAYLYRNGHAKRVELQTGIRTAAALQVLSGINQGDTLILSGVMQLRDGLPVIIDKLQNEKVKSEE